MSGYPKIHLSFPVSDLDRSVSFYKRLFGEDPVKSKPGYVKFLPTIAPLNLALHPGRTADTTASQHMGIEVADRETVLDHLRRVKESGMDVREEMNVDCCHANQDKFWVEDPDGREWEIYVLNRDIDEPDVYVSDGCCDIVDERAEQTADTSAESSRCCG